MVGQMHLQEPHLAVQRFDESDFAGQQVHRADAPP